MSVDIVLPGDCEVTAEARMSTRPGCSASGADSGDKLRVTGTSPHAWQTGAGNATLFDTNTQQGGTLTIEGTANRADEIITYEVFFVSGTCPFCILLPVELVTFDAHLEGNTLGLFWETASEQNNRGFTIQTSRDGASWENKAFVPGNGNTSTWSSYAHSIDLPSGVWYIRLEQEDYNGETSYSPILAVEIDFLDDIEITPTNEGAVIRNTANEAGTFAVSIYSPTGQLTSNYLTQLAQGASMLVELNHGMNIVQVTALNQQKAQRIFRR